MIMATSGSFYTQDANTQFGVYRLRCEWELESQDSVQNTSRISWTVTLESDSGLPCLFSSGSVSIDGTTVFQRGGGLVPAGSVVASGSTTLEHDADGTKDFVLKVTGASDYFSVNISGTQTYELPAMLRASAIASVSDVVFGSSCSIRWTPAATSYKFRLSFVLNDFSHETDFILPERTYSFTYNRYVLPLSAAESIPNSTSGSVEVTLSTYTADGVLIGSDTKTFTATVPESMKPVISMTVSPLNEATPLSGGGEFFVQGKSKARVSFEGSVGQYGATIESFVFYIGATRYSVTEAHGDSDTIVSSGAVTVKGIITDSRGLLSEASETIDVLAYSQPALVPYSGNSIVCERTADNDIRIEVGRQFSRLVVDGTQNNFCSISYRYAQNGAFLPEEWTEILAADAPEDKVSFLGGVTLEERTSYTVELKAEDDLGGVKTISFSLSSGSATFHLKAGGKGAAFGKYAENDGMLDVAWDIQARKSINGAFISCFNVSTTTFSLSMTGGAQNMLMFGKGMLGVLEYDGTSTTWNGNDGVSCSTAGGVVSVTCPNTGGIVAISDNLFEKI